MSVYICKDRLSVRDAAVLREELLKLMDNDGDLVIDMSSLERTDLAILQVFIAASKEGKRRGISVKFKSLTEQVNRQMVICGMKK